ncbi:MAG: hypothetical protein ACFFG0_00940 [Candidatus Thorarchaeota archaeon]
MLDKKIKRNRVKCSACREIIESKNKNGVISCRCRSISISGGKYYLGRYGMKEHIIELSEFY